MNKTSVCLIVHKGKILLLLRDNNPGIPNPNTWQTIGGGLEPGETFEEAVKREVLEETGLAIRSGLVYNGMYCTKDVEAALYIYYPTNEEASRIRLGNEGQRLGFFSLKEMDDLEVSFSAKALFTKYRSQLERIVLGERVGARDLGLRL
jgi:8-oxo-dGTP diphosphatase